MAAGQYSQEHIEKIALCALYEANRLRDQGLITGNFPSLKKHGRRMYKKLIKSGFKPTSDEMAEAISHLVDIYAVSNTEEGNNLFGEIMGMDNSDMPEH